jgi:hypothetical protein
MPFRGEWRTKAELISEQLTAEILDEQRRGATVVGQLAEAERQGQKLENAFRGWQEGVQRCEEQAEAMRRDNQRLRATVDRLTQQRANEQAELRTAALAQARVPDELIRRIRWQGSLQEVRKRNRLRRRRRRRDKLATATGGSVQKKKANTDNAGAGAGEESAAGSGSGTGKDKSEVPTAPTAVDATCDVELPAGVSAGQLIRVRMPHMGAEIT